LIKSAIIVFFLFLRSGAFAQSFTDSNAIDISTFSTSFRIINHTEVFTEGNSKTKPGDLINVSWQPLSRFTTKKYIPNDWITKAIFLKFTLQNGSDTARKVYFIAGTYIRSINIFKTLPNLQFIQLKDESRQDGYQSIVLKGKEKHVFIVKFNFTKRYFNMLEPLLIFDGYLTKHRQLSYYRNDAQPAAGYLLSGILLMMIFFTAANFVQSNKKEFLYNCCYSICMFGLIFLNTFLERRNGILSSLFHGYLDFVLLATGTVFYIAFTRKFLDTKTNHPLLNKIFVNEEKLVIVIVACFTFVVFFTNNFHLQNSIENGMKIIALFIGIIYIVIALAQKNKLMNYLGIGNAILIFFSIISFWMIIFPNRSASIFSSAMLYYELGIVCELIFFLLGLTYKNRVELITKIKEQEALKLEAEKQSFETQIAVLNAQQEERNRISADMHDDLGAGVTAIRLYSELAKKRIGKEVIPELEKISSSANELLNNMNAIIWTMSSSNDSLDNMVAYIRGYALEYFENTGINCRIKIEEDLPNIAVAGEVRRNIYLVVKEALNNILKHSKATEVIISLKKSEDQFSVYIQDNGVGIDFDNLRRFGNGLINMKKRMEKSQITFSIESNNGTLVSLHRKF